MRPPPVSQPQPALKTISAAPAQPDAAFTRFIAAASVLTGAFGLSLYQLFRFSLATDLYSHIILIPVVSGYLAWQQRASLSRVFIRDARISGVAAGFGAIFVAVLAFLWTSDSPVALEDKLAISTSAYLSLLVALAAWFLGRNTLRQLAFPIGFLIFMVPMPTWFLHVFEAFLQHGSAHVAFFMIDLAGTPIFRDGLVFHLPGISLHVAPECSGIRSTLALFITSIVAGYLFLKSPKKRLLLAAFVIPLALVRNGFRVFTIAELCVHVSPDMIHSYIHKQGGPIFFALSLIPFAFFLRWLVRSERKKSAQPLIAPNAPP